MRTYNKSLINSSDEIPWIQDDIDAELGSIFGTIGKIVTAPVKAAVSIAKPLVTTPINIAGKVGGTVGGLIGGKTGANIGSSIAKVAAGSPMGVMGAVATAKPAGQLIGAIAGKPVISLSGRTQMTTNGQLTDGASVSKPIVSACGTTTTADMGVTAGIRELPRLIKERLEPELKPIQRMLSEAAIQREATSEHNAIMSRRDFQQRVINDLDVLARCKCNANAMSGLTRFRAALGL